MKVTVEHVSTGENEIIIKCQQLDKEVQDLLNYLDETNDRMVATKEGETFLLQPNELYYVESVDNKIFLYTKDNVLETKDSLAFLETRYTNSGLVRIGKSQLVNLHQIKKLKSILNRRIEVTLESGERLIVSRHYVPEFKNRLGLESRKER